MTTRENDTSNGTDVATDTGNKKPVSRPKNHPRKDWMEDVARLQLLADIAQSRG